MHMSQQERSQIYNLQENEWLLKVRQDSIKNPMAFLAKPLKNKTVGSSFAGWDGQFKGVHTETFRPGWKFGHFRIGQSQQWVALIAPEGWMVEIYLGRGWRDSPIGKLTFTDILETVNIVGSELQGEFKWNGNFLCKQ